MQVFDKFKPTKTVQYIQFVDGENVAREVHLNNVQSMAMKNNKNWWSRYEFYFFMHPSLTRSSGWISPIWYIHCHDPLYIFCIHLLVHLIIKSPCFVLLNMTWLYFKNIIIQKMLFASHRIRRVCYDDKVVWYYKVELEFAGM